MRFESNNSTVEIFEDYIIKTCTYDFSFFQEVYILKLLQGHPNFPVLLDYDIPKQQIKMKKYDAIPKLEDYQDEIYQAIHHLHQIGIIHGDLKPDNILFDGVHPIIIDFGNSHFDIQDSFNWCCTKKYSPNPKYHRFERYSFDVWSLSVIFGEEAPIHPENRPHACEPFLIKAEFVEQEMTQEKWDKLFQIHRMYKDSKRTLLAYSFLDLELDDIIKHVKILLGMWYEKKTDKIEPTYHLIPRWMKKHNLVSYNQVLRCLLKHHTLDVEKINTCSTKNIPTCYFLEVEPKLYEVYLDTFEEYVELFEYYTEKEQKENFLFFLKKFKSFCYRNKLFEHRDKLEILIQNYQ